MTDSNSLISCLCLTHKRLPMLRCAIACFLAQTHPQRELIVLHLDSDPSTRDYLRTLDQPMIRSIELPVSPHVTLGARRNLLIEAARGRYVANWDDDDWHAPTRLTQQLQVIASSGLAACVLRNLVFHDRAAGQSYLTQARSWEQTVLAMKQSMPLYGDLDIGDDVVCVQALAQRGQLAELASPHLYVYSYHGANAGSVTHFRKNLFAFSQPLEASFSLRIGQLLQEPGRPAISLQDVLAARQQIRP
jgi:glycosyltransferase involved in cell wall biosynthesis